MLRIAILGPLRAWHGGEPLGPPKRRDTGRLWAYLLLHRGVPMAREAVARALWPDSEDPRFELRFNLHHLGKHLPPEAAGRPWLVVDRDHVAWNPAAPAEIDLDTFRDAVAAAGARPADRAELQAALSTVTGPLLQGMDEPWIEAARADVEAAWRAGMERLAGAHATAGDAPEAVAAAERLIEHDRLREASYRLAMRLHLARGDRAGAAAVLERCRRMLAAELGVEPEAETVALLEAAPTGATGGSPGETAGHAGVRTAPPAGAAPRFTTPFVGHDRVDLVAGLLDANAVVTLIGAPGIGKSRLAAAVAHAWLATSAADAAAPVAWLDVAAPGTAGAVAPRLAAAFGRAIDDPDDGPAVVADVLDGRDGLLVLDNAVEADTGCARWVEVLSAAVPGLRILVTSRAPLGTRAEVTWRVVPLAVPAAHGSRDGWSPAAPTDAVALFLSRAAPHVRPHLLTQDQAMAVARICVALDGVPEVIVRAAAALDTVPLADLAHACAAGDLATIDGARGVDGPRHAGWGDSVGWTVDRLPPIETALAARLVVFGSGFDCAAVEAVCAGAPGGGVDVPSEAVVDALDHLIARSLVHVDVNAAAPSRHRLLAPVRWALACRPGARDEVDAVRARLAEWSAGR